MCAGGVTRWTSVARGWGWSSGPVGGPGRVGWRDRRVAERGVRGDAADRGRRRQGIECERDFVGARAELEGTEECGRAIGRRDGEGDGFDCWAAPDAAEADVVEAAVRGRLAGEWCACEFRGREVAQG